jgi:hypothetical protein
MVAEVLAPDTCDAETIERLREYKQVSTLEYILLIEPNAPVAMLWFRDVDCSWQMCVVDGLGPEIAMPALGVTLAMGEIYDGITFPTNPSFGRLS